MLKKRIPILFLMIIPLLATITLMSVLYTPEAIAAPEAVAAITWTEQTTPTMASVRGIAYNGSDLFVAVGDAGMIMTSADGATWTLQSSGTITHLADIVYSPSHDEFAAVGQDGLTMFSSDGSTWITDTQNTDFDFIAITHHDSVYVVVGNDSSSSSADSPIMAGVGVGWFLQPSGTTLSLTDITHDPIGDQYVAVGGNGSGAGTTVILTSANTTAWVEQTTGQGVGEEVALSSVTYADGKLVVGDAWGGIMTSADGVTWTPQTTAATGKINAFAHDGSQFVSVGEDGYGAYEITTSPDGTTWTMNATAADPNAFFDIIYDSSQFVAAASAGVIFTSDPPTCSTPIVVTSTLSSGAGTLRQAITDVCEDGLITFDNDYSIDISTDGELVISKSLTINGETNAITVSGGNATRVFNVMTTTVAIPVNVTFDSLTIADGNIGAREGGGGIALQNSGVAVTVTNSILISNTAYYGGGVYVASGSIALMGTQIISNTATIGGGVLLSESSATLNMNGGAITGNSAIAGGGGIYVASGSIALTGTQVNSNTTSNAGGGVYVYDGSAALVDTEVISNTAPSGGGVFLFESSATLNMNGGAITGNLVTSLGGGVYVGSGSATLTGTQVINNTAGGDGGGIYISTGTATLTGTQIISNTAADDGGGAYLNRGTLNMNEGAITGNLATSNGGGVFLSESSATLNMNGGAITGNLATFSGGGVAVYNGTVTLTGTQVISNTAASGTGGGVYVNDVTGALSMIGGAITSNTAGRDGGGVDVYNGTVTLTGTQVISNTAVRVGGGVAVVYGSVSMNEVTITSNTAGSGGGGGVVVIYDSAILSMIGGAITSNSTSDVGGGILVSHGTAILTGTSVLNNMAGNDGGGLYLGYAGTITATNGCIVNNSDTAVYPKDSLSFVDASDNWWGMADGPGGTGTGTGTGTGDTVYVHVTYDNFKTIAPAGCPDKLAYAPEIDVQGNGQSIANGSTTPSIADDTDFGSTAVSGGTVTHTFTISNTGDADLTLPSGATLATGTHFSVTAQPASPVISDTTTTFNVTFDPTAAGPFTDTVSIANNDSDENPYTFVISGTGTVSTDEADLAISQSIAFDFLDTLFIITAQNNGPDAAPDAVVSVMYPAEIVVTGWTCAASGGAICPAASGSGDLPDQTLATFPSGGSVVYTMRANVSGSYANVATITPPVGVTDPDMSNNESTQMSAYLIILPIIYNNASFTP